MRPEVAGQSRRELVTLSSEERRRASSIVVAELRRDWASGRVINDAEVLANHPHLMPELEKELTNARVVRAAVLAARKAGPSEGRELSLPLLSDEEIEAPIVVPEDDAIAEDDGGDRAARPRIPGYVVLDRVSEGGQATVYRAAQESTGRVVAMKVMVGGSLGDSRQRARFEREAEILAKLRHPHVVNIIDRCRTCDGDFVLLMEFVEGSNLDDWWSNNVPAGEEGTRLLLRQFVKICRAVHEAHA